MNNTRPPEPEWLIQWRERVRNWPPRTRARWQRRCCTTSSRGLLMRKRDAGAGGAAQQVCDSGPKFPTNGTCISR